ncbi:release factor glutamine methyltransferase [Rhizobium dioscoreae]|uniref:Release factor glutamine methyltransferase n=1 Tax=Rhizobium dioscoreae TaxID=2653122 RepID=A0ABQ0ZCE5_9HYPH|nr:MULTISPECIES: peptide chain release factor N(5)-glutamine methyltransferase [Rhizobium]TWB09954.1 release factor glutamine methyltransferase [Rhizobium sp. ERR1071]GES47320.1 release factor glutamine methyltransferase [Rhizobium dioscoreae]GES52944.1 release factor glutamine methyltransferase [Rhizobium dioscoreae]GLU84272.1 release factor glutamine methyltransferase [Rhizobium sp. NBRC 114257]
MSGGQGPTASELLQEARARFAGADLDDPATEARILVGGLLHLSATGLVTHGFEPVSEDDVVMIRAAIDRRLNHEPVYRILGEREFYGLSLRLSAATLEPRPDTEILVDTMLPHVRRLESQIGNIHILDIGTGTGAICLALLRECPKAMGVGSDISSEALETARGNAERNGLAARFRTVQGSWFEAIHERFHVIVSNPPYIASSVISTLAPEVKDFDPPTALDGGLDGLDAYRAIAKDAARFLYQNGMIGVEIGYDQRETVTSVFEGAGFSLVEAVRDYGQNDRVLVFEFQH